MQLPRGRFDRFVQDGTILGIIKELRNSGYSGRCSAIIGESAVELIFEEGIIILAESSSNVGADMLAKLRSDPGGTVSAELSVFDSSQLKLAKEFNPKCVVAKDAFQSFLSISPETNELPENENADESGTGPGNNVDEAPGKEDSEVFGLDEAEIDSIVGKFRSGARDLLKNINLDHLVVENKSGEDNDD